MCGIEVKARLSHKRIDDNTASALLSASFIDTIDPLPDFPHVNGFGILHSELPRIKNELEMGQSAFLSTTQHYNLDL